MLNKLLGRSAPAPAPVDSITLTAQVTTDATGLDGVRHAADSAWQVATAPAGFVFAEKSASVHLDSGNGSEVEYRLVFSDYVEVVPGITQPRKVAFQAHARSPHGHATGRGWAIYTLTVNRVRLPV